MILSVSDRSGSEVLHAFAVRLQGGAGVPPALPDPPAAKALKLPPADPVAPGIRPPAQAADRVVQPLPSEVGQVTVGGGGRFLLLHLPKLRQVAVFDVAAARVVRSLPVPAGDVKIAAGLDKLVVALADGRLFQRWDLLTGRRELTAELPLGRRRLTGLAMGHASHGPLLVATADGESDPRVFLFDILALQRLDPAGGTADALPGGAGPTLTASADGRVFGIGDTALGVAGPDDFRLRRVPAAGARLLGPDGEHLFGRGVFDAQGARLDERPFACLPATRGDLYLGVRMGAGPFGQPPDQSGDVAVYRIGEAAALAQLGDLGLDLRWDPRRKWANPLPLHQRVQLIPQAKLIVAVSGDNDRLTLRRFDPEAALAGRHQAEQAEAERQAGAKIAPPKLDRDRVVCQLPGKVGDLCIGGGGRFVLFGLPAQRQIALFDVNAARVVHAFPCADGDMRFAASKTKLVVAYPERNLVERWDLFSRLRELTAALPAGDKIGSIALGSATEGPVLLLPAGRGDDRYLDLANLRPAARPTLLQPMEKARARVSADGSTVVAWRADSSPQQLSVMRTAANGGGGFLFSLPQSLGHVTPGPDGKYLYTARGIFTAQEGKPVGAAGVDAVSSYVVPAVHGDLSLKLALGDGGPGKAALTLHRGADERTLARVPYEPGDFGAGGFDYLDRDGFGNDRRLLLIPDAKVLLLVPFSDDRVVVRRYDAEAEAARAGAE